MLMTYFSFILLIVLSHGCEEDGLPILSTSGFVSNMDIKGTGCGSYYKPYTLMVSKYQKISLTLYDFVSQNANSNMDINICLEYALIREPDSGYQLSVCSGSERQRVIYVSDGNYVQVGLRAPSMIRNAHFLLYFEGK